MGGETFLVGRATLHAGDSRRVLAGFESDSFDSIVCDPPYALVSIVRRFGRDGAAPVDAAKHGAYARASAGFMGKRWDTGETAFDPAFWAEALRVAKPGAHLAAFGGTRSYHRLACAIEDAGWEIRDQLAWVYGSGFPKSHNQPGGWGTALKPAWEPICLARRPLVGTVAGNILQHGTGALNIDGCRVHAEDAQGGEYTVKRFKTGAELNRTGGNWRPGDGVEYHGEMKVGRWPANLVHDGSPEVLACFPDAPGAQRAVGPEFAPKTGTAIYGDYGPRPAAIPRDDGGSAARFFYTAKADADDRLGFKHPTVKPVDLMQWLVRLVTPRGGLVLDPFAGTGTTGEAAWREGMRAVLVEREEEYLGYIRRRLELAAHPSKRSAVARTRGKIAEPAGPLFDAAAGDAP